MTKRKHQKLVEEISVSNPAKLWSGKLSLFVTLAGILVLTYLAFLPATKNGFINWDDNTYVFENSHLSKPISEAIPYFLGPHYFIGNYVPLTMIIYLFEYHAAGLSPHFFHLVNILFHILNVALVFWFIYQLSGKKVLVAALVALFFGIHPMHVESVAWIAELKDVLYCFFFMAGLISYLKHLNKGKPLQLNGEGAPISDPDQELSLKNRLSRFPFFTLLLFTLSILAKPAAASFPLVLLVLDFYRGRNLKSRFLWLEKIPFLIISIVSGLITLEAQRADHLIHDYYSFSQRIVFASQSLLSYIGKLFVPIHQSIFYPYPIPEGGHLPGNSYLAPLAVLVLFYVIYRSINYSHLIIFGFLFFFVNVILILQLISVGDAAMADRYTYVSYIGLFYVIAMGLNKIVNSTDKKWIVVQPLINGLLVVVIAWWIYQTNTRCRVWSNDDTIATDLLNKYPDNRLALNNKGFILLNQGKYDESTYLFAKAIKLKPDYTMAQINLMNAYMSLKNYPAAMLVADSAVKHSPHDANVLNKKGNILFAQQNYTAAIEQHKEALKQNKTSIYGYIFLSECYYFMKDKASTLKTIEEGLRYFPDNYVLLNSKGYIFYEMHQYTKALEYFKESLRMKPDYSIASVNLSDCTRALTNSLNSVKK